MKNIKKRLVKIEEKTGILNTKKEPCIITIRKFSDAPAPCPGFDALLKRAEEKGSIFFAKGRKFIVIDNPSDCEKSCRGCPGQE